MLAASFRESLNRGGWGEEIIFFCVSASNRMDIKLKLTNRAFDVKKLKKNLLEKQWGGGDEKKTSPSSHFSSSSLSVLVENRKIYIEILSSSLGFFRRKKLNWQINLPFRR